VASQVHIPNTAALSSGKHFSFDYKQVTLS